MKFPSKWLKKVNNALFCVDDDILSFDRLINGFYDEQLRIHMDTDASEMASFMSPMDWRYVRVCIDDMNRLNKEMLS